MSIPDEAQLLEDVAHARGEAKSVRSLVALYGLKGRDRTEFRRMLKRLVHQGRLVRLRGQRYGLPRAPERLQGQLSVTTRGFGFVAIDEPDQPDVFVAERDLHGALHGDTVEVALRGDSKPNRPAGEVIALVERSDARIVGLFERGEGREPSRLIPFDPHLTAEILIPERFTKRARDGSFVEARLLREFQDSISDDGVLMARVVAHLGRPDEPGTDVRVILRSFHLADAHSEDAVAEAELAAGRGVTEADLEQRRDLRDRRTVTIDGETARDFDDAISVEQRGEVIRLFVSIADVAAHVEEGSTLDAEAIERGTSVYFPDRAVHMLPAALAAGACSLRPGEDKLTLTAILDVDREGEVVASDFCESVIRSDRRMTYTEMKRLVVDRDAELREELSEFLPDLELMAEAAECLMRERERRGGLDFDLPEPIVKVDDEGIPIEIVESERNVAHRIIEEFMIAANRAVARFLDGRGEPALYRVHEPPSEEKARAFREAAKTFGHELGGGDEPEPRHFQAVLDAAKGRPEEPLLTVMALRSMSLALYDTSNAGHFGLALEDYLHFTSPIRRYPDLIVHRALKNVLRGQATPKDERDEVEAELAELAEQCSKTERNAEKAERALVEWKKAVYMQDSVGEVFEGRVTGIADFGVFVSLTEHHVEGLVRVQSLQDDWYEKDKLGLRLKGRDTGRTIRLGDSLQVRVTDVDVFRRRIDLEEA